MDNRRCVLRSRVKSGIFCMTVLVVGTALHARPAAAQSVAEPKTWTVAPFLGRYQNGYRLALNRDERISR